MKFASNTSDFLGVLGMISMLFGVTSVVLTSLGATVIAYAHVRRRRTSRCHGAPQAPAHASVRVPEEVLSQDHGHSVQLTREYSRHFVPNQR